ncbi:ATP-dependent DNA helicase RecG [Blautia stercoris]
MEQPEIFTKEQYQTMQNRLLPIYSLTKGMTNKMIAKMVRQVLEEKEIEQEYLSEKIRTSCQLAEYNYAVQEIHFPKNRENMILARKRLVFDEFLIFLLSVRQMKETVKNEKNLFGIKPVSETEALIQSLPYSLTNAQKKVWQEIQKDMTGEKLMARLVQGDVGSGKTILAFLAMLLSAQNGYQAALMVPTEVLAVQHFEGLKQLLEEHQLDFEAVLLTGSIKAKERREIYQKIENGKAKLIIGTHALIQENVNYKNLALVITDEQHRFGVHQREDLSKKGKRPHVLVMSATPIPRTLAIMLYGDLDLSVIDELPANRLPIKNCVVDTSYRKSAYRFMQKEIAEGRQVYVICPMVEESEGLEAENVLDYTKKLRQEMPPEISVGFLHGRMKPAEKNKIMEEFSENKIQILVSTTVIEVGVNVPNATVMMVENAERFGLAQLHQLRGRVGRGEHQSYCIFMQGGTKKEIKERLQILVESNDGFFIAGEDLRLRGPGDLFGIRQSGILEFKLADIYQDAAILKEASIVADEILEKDPHLESEEYKGLKNRLEFYAKEQMKRPGI